MRHPHSAGLPAEITSRTIESRTAAASEKQLSSSSCALSPAPTKRLN
jgi:hypothetical protein